MPETGQTTERAEPSATTIIYEQPLNERMRTFLRLEFLYNQTLYHRQQPDTWSARAAVASILEMLAITARGDIRSDVLKELERLSTTDALTDVFNRRHLNTTLAAELLRARDIGLPLAVIMFDADHFKKFNDVYGHQAGDALLRGLGAFLRHHVRGEDIPCRYGGEEFILILPGATPEGAAGKAERVRIGIETELKVPFEDGFLPQVTVSLGVAVYPLHANSADDAIKAADAALYESKRLGRNRVSVSTS